MEISETLKGYWQLVPTSVTSEKFPYRGLRIVPYKDSYKAEIFIQVMNTIAKYNKPFLQRFEYRQDERKLVYHPQQPLSFETLYTKDKISYFWFVPEPYADVFNNKLKFLLPKCDLQETDDYLHEFKDSIKTPFNYQKSWLFSINCDNSINVNDNLMVLHKDLLTDKDKILFQTLLLPLQDYEWKSKFTSMYQKYAETGIALNGSNIWDYMDRIFAFSLNLVDTFLNGFMLAIAGEEVVSMDKAKDTFTKELNSDTKHKVLYDGFKTNCNLFVKTDTAIVAENIIRNTATILQDLNGDNSFKTNRGRFVKDVSRDIQKGFITNTLEAKQMIRTLSEPVMKEYENIIDKINVADIEMPKDLFEKGVCFGEMKKGSIYRNIFFGIDKDSNCRPLVYVSPQGGGKSTFSRMYSIAYGEIGDSVVIFETIDGKSKDIVRDYLAKDFPEEKIVVLDYANDDYILPLLWNEITDVFLQRLKNAQSDIEKYRILEELSGIISTQLNGFVDTLQSESREQMLTPQMRKMLSSITQLVFMNDGTFGLVKDALWDANLRHQLLKNLNLPEHLPFCKDILRIDKEPPLSTTLKGIDSRLNILMDNPTMKKHFSVNPSFKINFAELLNKGSVVIVNVPESKFGDNINPIITFLVAKLWMSLLSSRVNIKEEDRRTCHIVLDEIHRFPHCLNLLQNKILECRKWRIRPTFYIHNMDVFARAYENLKSAGATFIMMPTSEYNFFKVKEFFAPYGYDELKEVEKLNSKYPNSRFALCSIYYKNVNYPCVVKLLQPIEKRYKKTDRSYLDKKYAEMFGIKQDTYYSNLFNVQTKEDAKDEDDDIDIDVDNDVVNM